MERNQQSKYCKCARDLPSSVVSERPIVNEDGSGVDGCCRDSGGWRTVMMMELEGARDLE
jgi:hypothetical protein